MQSTYPQFQSNFPQLPESSAKQLLADLKQMVNNQFDYSQELLNQLEVCKLEQRLVQINEQIAQKDRNINRLETMAKNQDKLNQLKLRLKS